MVGRAVASDETDVLTAAADRLAVERRRIEDEIAAFAAFERAVGDIEPAADGDGPLAVHTRAAVSTQSDGLEAVRSAYERTVMAVPHYGEDYGDTYEGSVAEEFGPSVAAAVLGGSSFTDRHKSVLLSAAAEARCGRESMRSLVEDEREAVETAAKELREVERELAEVAGPEVADASFGTLESLRERLLDLETRLERGVERRQETIAHLRRRTLEPVEATDYREFFYAALDVEYPVLSAYAGVLAQVGRRQRDVEREMAYADD
jgi:hypothetical protein